VNFDNVIIETVGTGRGDAVSKKWNCDLTAGDESGLTEPVAAAKIVMLDLARSWW